MTLGKEEEICIWHKMPVARFCLPTKGTTYVAVCSWRRSTITFYLYSGCHFLVICVFVCRKGALKPAQMVPVTCFAMTLWMPTLAAGFIERASFLPSRPPRPFCLWPVQVVAYNHRDNNAPCRILCRHSWLNVMLLLLAFLGPQAPH